MADFSASGVLDLPRTTAESLTRGDPRVLGWLREWVQEGDAINRQDPSYDLIGRAQDYIVGQQRSPDQCKLKYLPQVTINETRKAMQAHVSAITDLKPVAGWKTHPEYQVQANLLNQYLMAEWVTTMMDLDLGDCVKYSLAGGTGDLVVDWDPHVPLGGAHQLTARDPRDTLPLRPSFGRSAQLWEGVCFREEHTVNVLRGMYPTRAHLFTASSDTLLGQVMGRFRTGLSRLLTPADPLDSIAWPGTAATARKARMGALVLYRAYFRDRTRNLTDQPIPMGTPGTNWAYVVQPTQPLYPRGRLLVATEDALIYDGPNTYWHGMFPFCRLKLWSVPWQFLGIPLFNDLLPLQDAINDTVNDVRLAISQWTNPDVTYNRNAVSEATMKLMDPRRPGKRVKVMPGFGDPWKKEDGPNPSVIQLGIEMWQQLTQKFADLSGTANLTALLQLRQMPSADTIQKYYEALTPEIRQEARQVELFLRDFSEMVKINYFQFLSQSKRVQILGTGGQMLDEFDVDPDLLVPALLPGQPGYTPELDAQTTTRDQRAQYFHKQFVFIVAPNSVLAMDATERKMMRVQLARMGYYDFWSLHETLETPNVGAPPAIPLPPLAPPPPGVLEGMLQQAMGLPNGLGMMAAGAMPLPQYTDPASQRTFALDPSSGQLLEIRVPVTVTERLQAQALLGIGQTVSPAGRKASGQAPPQQEEKSDGRSTITESEK
ncbi:MAG TPA: hypothetical protein VIX41_05185 [Acidimicrobiales bacterium]